MATDKHVGKSVRASLIQQGVLLFLLPLLLQLSPSLVSAADDNGDFVVKGVGAVPCSQFLAAAERGGAEELGEYGGFVAGYTSAYNEITSATFDVWNWQTLDTAMLLLLQRCRQNPELTFGAALVEVTRYFAVSGVSQGENTRLVGGEDKGFYLYETAYEELLKALRNEGYATDDPYAALMKYKVDKQVLNTANVHQVLLLKLIGPAAN